MITGTDVLTRVPPDNLDAEQGVLGSMLLDRDAIAVALEGLRAEDFYRDAHRTIFTAMAELFERGEPVDLITVTNRLADAGTLEAAGGPTYLAALPNVVPTSRNVEFYTGIVTEKAMLRALIGAGSRITALGYDGADEPQMLLDEAERLVFAIGQRRQRNDVALIRDVLRAAFEKIDQRRLRPRGHDDHVLRLQPRGQKIQIGKTCREPRHLAPLQTGQ